VSNEFRTGAKTFSGEERLGFREVHIEGSCLDRG
jgi:hypothetical protein